MKSIQDFARQPTLLKIELDTPEIREEFGDTVIFYMKDFVDINTYFEFYRSQSENSDNLAVILKRLILNESGQPVIQEGFELPATLAIAALSRINDILGKSEPKPSTSETGTQPA